MIVKRKTVIEEDVNLELPFAAKGTWCTYVILEECAYWFTENAISRVDKGNTVYDSTLIDASKCPVIDYSEAFERMLSVHDSIIQQVHA